MNTIRRTHTLPDGRATKDGLEDLLVRIDVDDVGRSRVTLGIKRGDGTTGWQLTLAGPAVSWIENKLARAWESFREENPVESPEGGD